MKKMDKDITLEMLEYVGIIPQAQESLSNWTYKLNRELAVGDRIVTKFDNRSNKAMAGVTITETIHNPRGCKAHVHIKTDGKVESGCYDFIGRTAVFL